MHDLRDFCSKLTLWLDNLTYKINNKKYNCSGPPTFQSQIEYQSNQIYYTTISIQKTCPVHKFNLKRQNILGSHKLKSYGHF